MTFTYLAFCYLFALFFTAFLIFFAIWHVIAFDELKNDHKNPIDQCRTLNLLVLPEYCLHGLIVLLILIGGDLITFLLNLPLILFNIRKYLKRPLISGWGIYDPTSIMHGDILNLNIKEGWIRLAFYMLTFFYYLYCFITELIA
jgi:protein cornichon